MREHFESAKILNDEKTKKFRMKFDEIKKLRVVLTSAGRFVALISFDSSFSFSATTSGTANSLFSVALILFYFLFGVCRLNKNIQLRLDEARIPFNISIMRINPKNSALIVCDVQNVR